MIDIILVCDDLFGLDVYSVMEQVNIWNLRNGYQERYRILGYISDSEAPFGNVKHSVKRLGSIHGWKPLADERYVLGVKMPDRKKQVVAELKGVGCIFQKVYTPWMLAPVIEIGEGSVVSAYSIKPGMKIGDFATVIDSMLAYHSIGDYSTVLRTSNITGDVGNSAYIGNHVYTHLGVYIGDNSCVDDGSVVVKNVKPGTSVSGVPARKMKERKDYER